ncbi:MAG: type 2 isopentenyl-diphosphate Delta-isomerase [Balneolia bacterium]|nr:type 2 isopentenyl-diphosphate Delta-isomerase [Balneolia bacterium]
MSIKDRKKDHVRLCLDDQSAYRKSAGFEAYDFVHNALPEIDFNEVDTSAVLLGRRFDYPLFVSSMTGGYSEAGAVNAVIASFCEKNNLPFGVGSQRVMLEKPEETDSFSVVREHAPTAFIAANIGGVQLATGLSDAQIDLLVGSIRADAIIVHLNPLQELMQPEGDLNFKGILNAVKELVAAVEVPVIVKETGAGISASVGRKLYDAGVRVIDTAGAGGTSWSKVENHRTGNSESIFNEWGIPTAECIRQLAEEEFDGVELISSGGIRSSLDIAKSLCLGADFAATAQPVIQAIIDGGEEELQRVYEKWKYDLRVCLCLLGVSSIDDMNSSMLRPVFRP